MTKVEKVFKDLIYGAHMVEALKILNGPDCHKINLKANGKTYLNQMLLVFIRSNELTQSYTEHGKEAETEAFFQIVEILQSRGINDCLNKPEEKSAFISLLEKYSGLRLSRSEEKNNLLRLIRTLCLDYSYYTESERKQITCDFLFRQPVTVELMEILEEKGFDFSCRSEEGRLIMFTAVEKFLESLNLSDFASQKERLDFLLKRGASIKNDELTCEALIAYLRNNNFDSIREAKAKTTVVTDDTQTFEVKSMLEKLLEWGGNVNSFDKDGKNVVDKFITMCEYAHDTSLWRIDNITSALLKLKEYGADLNKANKNGESVFINCLRNGLFKSAAALVMAGAECSILCGFIDPPFFIAQIMAYLSETQDKTLYDSKIRNLIFNRMLLPSHLRGENLLRKDIFGRNFLDLIYEDCFYKTRQALIQPTDNKYYELVDFITQKFIELGYPPEEIHPTKTFKSVEYLEIDRILYNLSSQTRLKDYSYNWDKSEILRKTRGGDNLLTYLFKYSDTCGKYDISGKTFWQTMEADAGKKLAALPYFNLMCSDYDGFRQSPAYCALETISRRVSRDGVPKNSNTTWLNQAMTDVLISLIDAAQAVVDASDVEFLSEESLLTGKNCLDLAGEILTSVTYYKIQSPNFTDDLQRIYLTLREKGVGFSFYKDWEASRSNESARTITGGKEI